MDKKVLAVLIILILCVSLVLAATDIFEGTVVVGDKPTTTPIVTDGTIVQYLRILNKNVVERVEIDLGQKTDTQRNEGTTDTSGKKIEADSDLSYKSFTLNGVSKLYDGKVFTFPKVNGDVLSVKYEGSSIGEHYIQVYLNNKEIDCYHWNFRKALFVAWVQREAICDESYGTVGKLISLNYISENDNVNLKLTSPLISSKCNGKSIDMSSSKSVEEICNQ